jgi:hypothetical protein
MGARDQTAPQCRPNYSLARQPRLHVFGVLLWGRDEASDRAASTRRGTGYSHHCASSVLEGDTWTPSSFTQRWASCHRPRLAYYGSSIVYHVTEGIRTVVGQLSQKPVSPSEVLPSQASKGESAAVSPTALSPQPAKPPSSLKPEAVSLW